MCYRGMPFTVDNRWAWSLDQPCAWEWRVNQGSEAAQHLKTPIPLAKALPSSTAAPDQDASLAAAENSHLPASQSAVTSDIQQQKADRHDSLSKADTGDAQVGPTPSTGLPNAHPLGQQAAQVPRACLTECNGRGVEADRMLPPKPPKAAKRLKFSELASDLAETHSQACTSAITALAQRLARPACQAGLPHQAQLRSFNAVGSQMGPDSATPGAVASADKAQAASSPSLAQALSQKQPETQQRSDRALQADPGQAAGGMVQCSSPTAGADGVGPPGTPSSASDRAR